MNKKVASLLRTKKYKDMPVLIAFRRNGTDLLSAWCPFCRRWHQHGTGEGHRVAHCGGATKNPFRETGYFIVEGKGTVQAREDWQATKYDPGRGKKGENGIVFKF